jgi:hypothetical protein
MATVFVIAVLLPEVDGIFSSTKYREGAGIAQWYTAGLRAR